MTMTRRMSALLLVTTLGLTTACTDQEAIRKQKVLSELKNVESERDPLARQVTSRIERLSAQQNRIQNLNSQLEDYNRDMEAYLMNHKLATAAIALGLVSGGVVLDDSNAFSDDAKGLAVGVAILAGIYALNYPNEVMEVADKLVQADAHVKNLKAQIAQAEAGVQQEKQLLASDRQQLQTMTERIAALRSQL